MSDPELYTVGWICAIHTEFTAAKLMFDESHKRGPDNLSLSDTNSYALGKIHGHNVAVAVLPEGEYGTTPAATVAVNMLSSFPNIRICLMVGIGGGAPSERHDIRLGDVVVSARRGKTGGVFQYDFGKAIQGQEFQTTGFLNQPPAILRTAINNLRSDYEIDGHCIEETVQKACRGRSGLLKKYSKPDRQDILYRAEVLHPVGDDRGCEITCVDETTQQPRSVERRERTVDEDNPAIHYGIIASANTLMKDAHTRDKLAAEKDVLCFEMEAAGLMNPFPCVVIRGICDYSDTHKNKAWQGYAAMVAAAYAKDLLLRIPPRKVIASKKTFDILTRDHRPSSGIEVNIHHAKSQTHSQEDLEVIRWLTPVEYGPQHSDFLRRRGKGTGQWFLESEKFLAWQETPGKTLFCPGIPGAGKTILTSVVIDHLATTLGGSSNTGLAYVYCSLRQKEQQTIHGLLASLIKQLAQAQASLPSGLKDIYTHHLKGQTQPSFEELTQCLQLVAARLSQLFIIIDAIDECDVAGGCRDQFMCTLFKVQRQAGAHILVTSRFIPDVENMFNSSIKLEIRADKRDIREYLRNQVTQLPNFVKDDPELQVEIIASITKAVEGIFLLAQLHMESLRGKRSVSAIRTLLRNLATGSDAYDKVYHDAMERIKTQGQDQYVLAKQILSWITYAKRPLATIELLHALAVKAGDTKLDQENIPDIRDMVSVCAGLVTVDQESGIIRLVHHTTQEFFERTRDQSLPRAEKEITTTCATYLSFDAFATGYCHTEVDFRQRLELHPFFDYAACHWGHHVYKMTAPDDIVISFLRRDSNVEAAGQALMADKIVEQHSSPLFTPDHMRGSHVAAYFGIEDAISYLSNNDANAKDQHQRTPLWYAAGEGHEAAVLLLLDMSAEINAEDSLQKTPLSRATERGHERVVKLLLGTGKADINRRDYRGRTPLLKAASRGHEAIVSLLLATGKAEVDATDNHDQTALSCAAEEGHVAIVLLLLATEMANVNARDTIQGWTPLSKAVNGGYEAIVRALLAREEIDVNARADSDQTPLFLAVKRGNQGIVELLLDKKADVNSKDQCGRTPLSCAAERGWTNIVKVLIGRHADIITRDKDGQTPMFMAICGGHRAVAELLRQYTARSESDHALASVPTRKRSRSSEKEKQVEVQVSMWGSDDDLDDQFAESRRKKTKIF